MTNIKPPARPGGGSPTDGALERPTGSGAAGETFRATLDGTPSAAQVTSEPVTAGAATAKEGAAAPTNPILEDLRAGRIDRETAVTRLVAEVLASPTARSLTVAGRRELEAHLQDSLREDPALRALFAELDGGTKEK